MPEPVLQLSNLTKIYRKSHLGRATSTVGVRDLTLQINKGEIFGLLGPNGAGKTTTLKLILGLLYPTQGEIRIGNRKMPDRQAIADVGFLPEVPYFPRHLSVEEVLHFYGLLSGLSEERVRSRTMEVLEQVKMFRRKGRKVRECSKGMLQRLSLAQALIHDPSFLVLDEPITGLDPIGLNEMRERIVDLNRAGKTILFSSHIIAEVERIAHRVAILVNGKLARTAVQAEWDGRPGELEKIFIQTVQEHGSSDDF